MSMSGSPPVASSSSSSSSSHQEFEREDEGLNQRNVAREEGRRQGIVEGINLEKQKKRLPRTGRFAKVLDRGEDFYNGFRPNLVGFAANTAAYIGELAFLNTVYDTLGTVVRGTVMGVVGSAANRGNRDEHDYPSWMRFPQLVWYGQKAPENLDADLGDEGILLHNAQPSIGVGELLDDASPSPSPSLSVPTRLNRPVSVPNFDDAENARVATAQSVASYKNGVYPHTKAIIGGISAALVDYSYRQFLALGDVNPDNINVTSVVTAQTILENSAVHGVITPYVQLAAEKAWVGTRNVFWNCVEKGRNWRAERNRKALNTPLLGSEPSPSPSLEAHLNANGGAGSDSVVVDPNAGHKISMGGPGSTT